MMGVSFERAVGDGDGVVVAVIDSGWDEGIVDIRVQGGMSVRASGDGLVVADDRHDAIGHGTACAEIVLQVAPRARVFPIRVFHERLDTSPAELFAAMEIAVAHGCGVLSLSLGTARLDVVNRLRSFCDSAERAGALVVAASGGAALPYPSEFPSVLGVAELVGGRPYEFAYDPAASTLCFASIRGYRTRALARPGAGQAGTSLAAAFVAGVVSRLVSKRGPTRLDEIRSELYRLGSEDQ